jgi:hypothetical protein
MAATPLEQVRHREKCQFTSSSSSSHELGVTEHEMESTTSERTYDPLKILYFCTECQQNLLLTSTQILKHKRSHKNSSNEKSNETNII